MRESPAVDPPSALPRRLGLWSAVAVVIGTTIGSGIFRSPASITNRLPGPAPLLTVWVVGGALAMCGALTLAEVAGAFPHTGGIYVFLREGWGRLVAFLFGWSELVIIRAAAIGAIYLLANVAYLAVMPVEEIRTSRLVAADVAQRLVGAGGVIFVSSTVMLSTFGTLNGSILTSPRIWFAMADDGLFFRRVAAVHPRFQTPYVAISIAAVLGAGFVLLRTFEQLVDTFVTAIIPFFALGVASIYVVRRRADYDPPFRTPGYPVVPALFVLATIYLLANAIIDPSSRWATLAVMGVTLLGIPVYYLTVGRRPAPLRERAESAAD